MKIAMGADHRGFDSLNNIRDLMTRLGHEVTQNSRCDKKSSDYPDIAWPVASAVAHGEVDRGVLICGSGVGMSIAANKVKGVRAALVHDELSAEMSRRHNDANVLCLSADLLGPRIMERIIQVWLRVEFEGGRHARRVSKITAIERGDDPKSLDDASASGNGSNNLVNA